MMLAVQTQSSGSPRTGQNVSRYSLYKVCHYRASNFRVGEYVLVGVFLMDEVDLNCGCLLRHQEHNI